MVFLPLMSREKALRPRQLFATCVAVIFPVCAVSAAVCLLRTDFDFLFALPYLVGGFQAGSWADGSTEKSLPSSSVTSSPPSSSTRQYATSPDPARKELPP